MNTVSRRTFLRGLAVSMAGASLSGCAQTAQIDGPDREVEDRVHFTNLRWRPIGPDDVWGLRADLVNGSGDGLRVECVLGVDGQEYAEVYELEPWATETVLLITEIPDIQPMPTEYELAAYRAN